MKFLQKKNCALLSKKPLHSQFLVNISIHYMADTVLQQNEMNQNLFSFNWFYSESWEKETLIVTVYLIFHIKISFYIKNSPQSSHNFNIILFSFTFRSLITNIKMGKIKKKRRRKHCLRSNLLVSHFSCNETAFLLCYKMKMIDYFPKNYTKYRSFTV